MQVNTLISVVIPTYNRADYLNNCLAIHIPLVKNYNIQIFISDNASTDNTKEIVLKHAERYPFIFYFRNETNIGPDENFERALKYPQTEYVWLLGDTYRIPFEGIPYLLNVISVASQKYDAVIFNVTDRVCDIPQKDYSDKNKLLADLGWHMTNMASLVYRAEIIENADFERYRKTNFIQTGIIFEYINKREFVVHWKEGISVQSIVTENLKKRSWQDRTFEIWTEDWANFVFSLPASYNLDLKLKCIMDHGKKSGVFTIKNLLLLRSENILNHKKFKTYSHIFPFTIKRSRFFILAISLLPKILAKTIITIHRLAKVS